MYDLNVTPLALARNHFLALLLVSAILGITRLCWSVLFLVLDKKMSHERKDTLAYTIHVRLGLEPIYA